MRGTGRPVIVPKEVLDAPLRVPNAFKNQIKSIVSGSSSQRQLTVGGDANRPRPSSSSMQSAPLVVPVKSETNGFEDSEKKFESGLHKLDILFSGPMEDLVIYRILDVLVFKDARTDEDLKAIATHTTDMVLTDSSNIIPICKYLFLFSLLPEKGPTLRSIYFSCVQKIFEEKRHSLKGTPKYVNFARFLAASVHYNRNPLFDVAEIFAASCLTVLQEMRDMSQEDEIIARAELFIRCAQYTKDSSPDVKKKFLATKNGIRNSLSDEPSLTQRSRLWLMFALECSDSVVPTETVNYYCERLGEQVNALKGTDFKFVLPKSDAKRFPISEADLDNFVVFI